MQQKKLKLDVMERLNQYWGSSQYIALNNTIGSTGYVQQSTSGEEITDEMLQHLHDRTVVSKGLRCNVGDCEGSFDEWLEWFDGKMWPLLKDKARELPGLYHFYLEMAIYSDAVPAFDYDAWTDNLATACLLAHGITHDVHGNMLPIKMNDPMLVYIKENSSLAFMRYRSQKAREEIIRLKNCNPDRKIRVGIFGGGAEPALWLGGPIDGVEIIIYDLNPVMKGVLEQILEQPLEELGIDYRTESFMNAFTDETMHDTFDLIIYNGVMSYYPEKKVAIAAGTRLLLKDEGVMFFDDILMHPDMVFGLKVRGWTVKLVPEQSLEIAVEKNEKALPEAGLVLDRYEYQDVRGLHNVVVTYAVKRPVVV